MFQIILHGDIFGTAISNVVCGTYFKRRKRGDMLLKITNKNFFITAIDVLCCTKNPYLLTFFFIVKKNHEMCLFFGPRKVYAPLKKDMNKEI